MLLPLCNFSTSHFEFKKDFEYCKQDSINMDDIAQNQAQIEAQHAQRFAGGTDKQYKPSFDSLMSFIAGRPFACK